MYINYLISTPYIDGASFICLILIAALMCFFVQNVYKILQIRNTKALIPLRQNYYLCAVSFNDRFDYFPGFREILKHTESLPFYYLRTYFKTEH